MTVLAKLVTVYTNDIKLLMSSFLYMFLLFSLVAYYLNVRLRVYNDLKEFGSLIWHYNLQFYDLYKAWLVLPFKYSNWLVQIWG